MLPIAAITPNDQHPCLNCGACCAFFRVAFYWREAESKDNDLAVPNNLWVELTDNYRAMKGTSQQHRPQCIALKGTVGSRTSCTIYSRRPSPCRDFKASYEDGVRNERCEEARLKHDLPPLTPQDWPAKPAA